MNRPDKAYELGKKYEQAYKGCGQCTIAALQETFGLEDEGVFKAGTGFAGGGALCGDGNCGAYTGAIMMLSYVAGRTRGDFEDQAGAAFRTFDLVRSLRERFIEDYGSVKCRDIQYRVLGRPYYLIDEEDVVKFEKAGGHDDKCPEVVGKAARWAAEIIEGEGLG